MDKMIPLKINGNTKKIMVHPSKRLIDVLRDDLGLMGVKEGCGEGECGACAVLIEGKLINSCLVAVESIKNAEIYTIEGYKMTKRYAMLDECFASAGAVQCGFCTPGMILAAEALLSSNAMPTESEVRDAISGNLCRCTGYNMIVEAILMASRKGGYLW